MVLFLLAFCFWGCRTITITTNNIISPTRLGKITDFENATEINLSKNDSVLLNAIHINNPNSNKVIYFLHGSGGSVWNQAAFDFFTRLNELKVDIFSIDYEGFGKSQGKFSINSLYEDAEVGYNYLSKNYNKDSIIVYGFSLGSAAACDVASRNKCGKLIMQGSFTNEEDLLAFLKSSIPWTKKPFLKLQLEEKLKFKVDKCITKVSCPILFIHGTEDDTTPLEYAERLYNSVQSPKKSFYVVKGAGHNNIAEIAGKDLINELNRFIN